MLSIKTWKSANSAISYYAHEKPELEYYAGNQQNSGYFHGLQAIGGCDGDPVTKKTLDLLMAGYDFKGNPLIQRAGKGHRAGYDLTFSAPKSVSILWALGSDETKKMVLEAHQHAVNEALSHIEKYAGIARRGKNGSRIEAVKNLMFAKFDHGTSRENDPQLHTHCLLFNIAQRQDESFGTIESRYIYEEKMAAGAIYQGQLAFNLEQRLGCQSLRKGNSFEVEGVPQTLIDCFSTRRNQIKNMMKITGYSSPKGGDISALTTRKPKTHIAIDELQTGWKSRSKGFDQDQVTDKNLRPKDNIRAMDFLESLTDFQSTFSKVDIRKHLALWSQTITNRQGFEDRLRKVMESDTLVFLGHDAKNRARYTTKDMHNLEQSLVNLILERQNESYFQVSETAASAGIKRFESAKSRIIGKNIQLTNEQNNMVLGLVSSPGATVIALGIAGSGKSFSLEAAKNIWETDGFTVVGMAPTGKASLGLQESTNIKSSTIDSFLLRQNSPNSDHKLTRNSILVVDEAGMIGSKKLAKLVDLSSKTRSKLVLVGDIRQLQSVDAGSAVKMVERKIGSVGLQKIYRQQQDWQRSATQFFADGDATRALSAYKNHGSAKIFPTPDAAQSCLIRDYLADRTDNSQDSRIVITETNQQALAINLGVKQQLFLAGKTSSGHHMNVKTRQSGLEDRHFAVGERILFTKNSRKLGVTNGMLGEILSVETTKTRGIQFTVETDSGRKVSFNSKDYKHIENGFAVTIHKSQGDTLDRSFFLLSEKTSREAAYVAMSRHRKDAKIYIDRTSFSDLIDWEKVEKAPNQREKIGEIEAKTMAFVGRKASVSQHKDTSLDYKRSHDCGIQR